MTGNEPAFPTIELSFGQSDVNDRQYLGVSTRLWVATQLLSQDVQRWGSSNIKDDNIDSAVVLADKLIERCR